MTLQGQYKHYYDLKVSLQLLFQEGQFVYIEKPQGIAVTSEANQLSQMFYNKLMPRPWVRS